MKENNSMINLAVSYILYWLIVVWIINKII